MNRLLEKEKASHQKRQWVRLTRVCNNRCVFCLDRENQDGTFISFSLIEEKLRGGIENGAERAVLSGGEPTLHPQFLEVVKFAHQVGYKKIQIITNGRMFSYKNFLNEAIENGVGEITFSIHGHTKELYEAQSRVKGSFSQAMRGLINALKSEKLIVNIDIVINKINYKKLPEILKFFINLGVYEFDLLQLVPFGDAWENRDKVFYDTEEALPYLKKAFEVSKDPRIHLWTNRFPVNYLEGFENLIQDPVKLYDEVRGRKGLFDRFLKEGKIMSCFSKRCKWCFLRNFCSKLILVKNQHLKNCSTSSSNLQQIPINKKTKGWILNNIEKLYSGREKVVFFQENHSKLSESKKNDINLREFFNEIKFPGFKIKNIPLCVYPKGKLVKEKNPDLSEIYQGNVIDIYKYTDWFIQKGYYTKSLRCKQCKYFRDCPGMHINYIRNFGYKIMSPLKNEDHCE